MNNNESNFNTNPKEARKKGVVRGVAITSLVSILVLIGAGIYFYSTYNKEQVRQRAALEAQKQEFTALFLERDSVVNEWVMTFDQIEKDLGSIIQKEQMISLQSEGTELSSDKREKILNDIKDINTLLEYNKKKIASLNAKLKNSGGSIQALEQKVNDLSSAIQLREKEMDDLKLALTEKDFKIEEMNTEMTGLQETLAQRDERINTQIEQMNTGYVAYGTYEDLEEKGLVTKEGGFLGLLGRKEALVEDFADSIFNKVDITEIMTIPVNSKDAKLITEHPSNSYVLVPEGEKKIAHIEIKDPQEFWKISRYAVVEIVE